MKSDVRDCQLWLQNILKDVPRGSILEVVGRYLEIVLGSTNGSTNGSNVLHAMTGGTRALALELVHQNETAYLQHYRIHQSRPGHNQILCHPSKINATPKPGPGSTAEPSVNALTVAVQSSIALSVTYYRNIIAEHRGTFTHTILQMSSLPQCHRRLHEVTHTARKLDRTWLYTILRYDFDIKLENTMPVFSITTPDPTYVLNLSGLSSLRHADGELLLPSTNEALGTLIRGSEYESILDAFERLHC